MLPEDAAITAPPLYCEPSTITAQSEESSPNLFEATHLYFPESPGCALIISMVMTPSV